MGFDCIINRASNVALDAPEAGNGTKLQQWDYNATDNQLWQFEGLGGGWCAIKGKQSGRVLDVPSGEVNNNGADVQLWDWNGSPQQQWQQVDAGGGWFWIKNRASGKALDVPFADLTMNGTRIQQWDWNGAQQQLWKSGGDPARNRFYSKIAAPAKYYGDYVDQGTGLVGKPGDWDDVYGDSVWRSSWMYASLLVIQAKDTALFPTLRDAEHLDLETLGHFLSTFLHSGCRADGLHVPGSDHDQQFTGDQLAPLLYLLTCIAVLDGGSPFRGQARDILSSMSDLVDQNGSLSAALGALRLKNLHYPIVMLADSDRLNIDYQAPELKAARALPAALRDAALKAAVRTYRAAFSAGLDVQHAGSLNFPGTAADNLFDETAFFNAVALVTAQCLIDTKDNDNVRVWRATFGHASHAGWGPAYRLAAGDSVSSDELETYRSAATCTALSENDIIMAQRARRFIDGTYPSAAACDVASRRRVLDYLVLKALQLAWM